MPISSGIDLKDMLEVMALIWGPIIGYVAMQKSDARHIQSTRLLLTAVDELRRIPAALGGLISQGIDVRPSVKAWLDNDRMANANDLIDKVEVWELPISIKSQDYAVILMARNYIRRDMLSISQGQDADKFRSNFEAISDQLNKTADILREELRWLGKPRIRQWLLLALHGGRRPSERLADVNTHKALD